MIELFTNINDRLRQEAEDVWNLASILSPERATRLLSEYTKAHSEEEQDFLQFYFNLQMEVLRQ